MMIKIVAECGVNFRSIEEAKQMIDECHELGLFATKFQIYESNQIKDHPQRKFLESIRLSYWDVMELFDHGKSIGQEVFFTPMFEEAVEWCEKVGVNYYKIRFNDRNEYELIDKIVDTRKRYFLSTNQDHWIHPTNYIKTRISCDIDPSNQINLYCIPEYPARIEDYQKPRLHVYDGISDHTSNMDLFKWYRDEYSKYLPYNLFHPYYFEKHVCLTKDCLESEWSCTFDELKEVLK